MAMPDSWREMFLQHASGMDYAQALQAAKQRLHEAADRYDRLHVAFSGGKDSLVCLHLAVQLLDPEQLWVAHYDFGRPSAKGSNVFPEWFERETESVVVQYFGMPLTVITKRRNFRSEEEALERRLPGVQVQFVEDAAFWIKATEGVAKTHGCNASVVGLRAQEGAGRKKRVGGNQWISSTMPEVWPVADWSELDVWAHIISHNLPYTSAYDRQAALTGSYIGLRTRSLFDDGCKYVTSTDIDGVLFWRDRPRRKA